MLRVITGVPGSGKTYWMVNHVVDHYLIFNHGEHSLKDGVLLVTNITGLQVPHTNLDDVLKKKKISINTFLTIDYQTEIAKKFPQVVIVIDEAQFYFPRKFYDDGVFNFFQYHRHLGIDVYLLTQNSFLLPRDLVSLSEYELRAVPRVLSVFGEKTYKTVINGEVLSTSRLRPRKKVYACYKSMTKTEGEKQKHPMRKVLYGLIAFACVVAYFADFQLFGQSKKKSQDPVKSSVAAESRQGKGEKTSSRDESKAEKRWYPANVINNNGRLSIVHPDLGLVPIENYPDELKISGGRYLVDKPSSPEPLPSASRGQALSREKDGGVAPSWARSRSSSRVGD